MTYRRLHSIASWTLGAVAYLAMLASIFLISTIIAMPELLR